MQRKHTTTACQICRDSKIKCDGARPACLTCTMKGRDCQYSTKDDKRKVSLRTAVDVLFARVERLTELAVQNNLPLPPLTLGDESMLEQICASLELPLRSVVPFTQAQADLAALPASSVAAEDGQFTGGAPLGQDVAFNALSAEGPSDPSMAFDMQSWADFTTSDPWDGSPSDWPWQLFNDFSTFSMVYPATGREPVNTGQPAGQVSTRNVHSNEQQPGSDSTSEDELETDIVPRLAARFGSLRVGADGRVRYYGSAANHHFLANSTRREEIVDAEEMRREALIALENAELDLEVPIELEEHLLELFFKWHNPCHLTVDRAMFEAARTQGIHGQSTYCSQALIAAMCALGAAFEGRYHHSFITFPKSLAEYFGDKSKVLLELELDSPCMSTLQTMLLLSSHEAAAGRDARMWLYSGTAMRLSFDLGLHIDSDPYVDQGLFTVQEAEARRICFWSCLVVNHIWSFSLGRPFRVDSEELTVKRLGSTPLSHPDPVAFCPTTPATSPMGSTSQQLRHLSCLVLEQWVYFVEELAPLIRVLYGCAKISKNALQNLSFQTSARFLKWQESIPDALKIQHDKPTLPHVLLLHMAYHNFCILIHRPWTSKSSQPPGKIGPGFQHARGVCLNAASEIAALLRTYEAHYGFRTMNVYVVTIIFSASLILIFGLIAEESTERQHQQQHDGQAGTEASFNFVGDVNTCFRALDELGQSFECAKRSREDLIALQNHWSQRRREIKLGAKRGRAAGAATSRFFEHASKRSRTSGVSISAASDVPAF